MIETDCHATDTDGAFLFRLIKGAVPSDVINDLGRVLGPCAMHNRKRGAAAGPLRSNDIAPGHTLVNTYTKIDGNGYRANKEVMSCVVGMTKKGVVSAYTRDNKSAMATVQRRIAAIDAAYAASLPEVYREQKIVSKGLAFRFGRTLFNSMTVNKNFRTGLHRDYNRQDAHSVLVIGGDDNVTGGALVFPEYGVACALRPGDILVFRGTLYHGNASMKASDKRVRLSFVLYQL